MKKLLSMVLCAMMALTLAGCGGSSDDSSTYTYSSELDIKNLDSSDADDGCSFTALHAIIDGLMKPAKDGTTTYGIAKSSEVSEDGLTHTYKLRDAKWSNGDAVTANDFVYAWQRIFKKKGNYYYMFCDGIANIAGAQELSDKIDAEQDLTDEDLNKLGVKAVDDKTLEITTTTRVSFFDELMSFPCFYPINEKFAEKQGDKYGKSADSILGNGAFVMTNWEPGSVAEFEKNDKFYAAKEEKIVITGKTPADFVSGGITPMQSASLLLILVAGISIYGIRRGKTLWGIDLILFLIAGMAGCILAFLALFSQHPAVSPNYILFVFHPFHLFCLPFMLSRVRKREISRYMLVNFAVLTLFIGLWTIIPQRIPPAVLPLALCLLIRSASNLILTYKRR